VTRTLKSGRVFEANLEGLPLPLRPLDWRWRMALRAYENQTQPLSNDTWLWKAYHFLCSIKKSGSAQKASCTRPTDYEAYCLHKSAHPTKALLEALRLCNDLSLSDTAKMLGLSALTVEAYERFFYDVTPLQALSPLALRIEIERKYSDPGDPENLPLFWKKIAMQEGYARLQHLLSQANDGIGARSFYQSFARQALAKRFAAISVNRPAGQAKQIAEQGLQLALADEDHGKDSLKESQTTVLRSVLGGIHFCLPDLNADVGDGREPRLRDVLGDDPIEIPEDIRETIRKLR